MFAFRQILRAAPPPPAAAAKMAVGTNMIDNRLYKTVDQNLFEISFLKKKRFCVQIGFNISLFTV